MGTYVFGFADGNKGQSALLGGKGANLAEMTNLGLPVPPGFTITTDACRSFLRVGEEPPGLEEEVRSHVAAVEDAVGRRLGDPVHPLLLSVRSGAQASMPGMMDTVLNIGLNDASVVGLAEQSQDKRFAADSYRRLLQMFGATVLGVDSAHFSDALAALKADRGVTEDLDLVAADLEALVATFQEIIVQQTGRPFPQDPYEQLRLAIKAVFSSWHTERAAVYRRREGIAHDLGTAVNVQAMVFGNRGMHSGSGVCFTRDPASGAPGVYGDYLVNAQGEDVVSGIRNTIPLTAVAAIDPTSYDALLECMRTLELHYRDLCDIEFTIEQGKLWMLQTRVGKRTPEAAVRIAADLVSEGVIGLDEALLRVTGQHLVQLMFPRFDATAPRELLGRGVNASPGAAVGRAVFDADTAVEWAAKGDPVILVRRETDPDDLRGMVAARGILTSRGGRTSHAAVVARGMGRTCVCGADSLDIDTAARALTTSDGVRVVEGDLLSLDGTTGEIFRGEVAVVDSSVVRWFEDGAIEDEVVAALATLMTHADARRRLRVHANADTAQDAARARRFGAEGIGLCRTEHMFLGERRLLVEHLIVAEDDASREEALAALLPLQRSDFRGLFEAMDGLPVTIRLLDPPLHEFLPDLTELAVRVALADDHGHADSHDHRLLAAVTRLHEQNPMLGLRGVRLGIALPGLYAMQARAILEAAGEWIAVGGTARPEIMVPLVAERRELDLTRAEIDRIAGQVTAETGVVVPYEVGTMIEVPRAALTAGEIAGSADFFSFGTNDLTQMTWGFSRDDVEASFFATYLDQDIFAVSPFESLDVAGVGELVRVATQAGRAVKPDLQLGVCGEHGGDPTSVHVFHELGLDYVSCSPFRVPVARLEAARAAILAGRNGDARA